METIFMGKLVKRQDILVATREFDSQYPDTNLYDAWLEKDNYKYALEEGGKLYPCKHVLSQVTGIDTSEFGGGTQTNGVFRKLGFHVIAKKRIGVQE